MDNSIGQKLRRNSTRLLNAALWPELTLPTRIQLRSASKRALRVALKVEAGERPPAAAARELEHMRRAIEAAQFEREYKWLRTVE